MKKNVFSNSIYGLILQIFSVLINFPIRYIILRQIGVEWLGLNETISSIIGSFSLVELGLNSIIGFYLFEPIVKKDYEKINLVVNIYKKIYKLIGTIIIVISIAFLPFLHFFITDVVVDYRLYILYFLIITNTVSTYFLAYRRVLLEADQKQYMQSRIELLFSIACSIIQIVVLLILKNYLLFVAIQVVKTILSNIYIHIICGKQYPFLKTVQIRKEDFKDMLSGLKNAAGIKIASYIYGSTDNVLISCFVSTVAVGYLSNYIIIVSNIKAVMRSVLYPIYPTIGNIIAEQKKTQYKVFEDFQFFSFLIIGICVIPMIVLADDFVRAIFGMEYVMSYIILLSSMDCILDTLQIPVVSFINGKGLFKYENKICFVGACTNIIISLCLVNILGIQGVLIGTIISQIVFIIMRSVVLFKYCLGTEKVKIIKYIFQIIKMIVVIAISVAIAQVIYTYFAHFSFAIRFIIGGLMCELVFVIFVAVLFWRNALLKDSFKYIKAVIRRK